MIAGIEMPKYKCCKEVWALKITVIEINEDDSATIAFENGSYSPITTENYKEKFKGSEEDKGYYVVYKDGYISWSPTEAFEGGYELIK